MIEELTTKRAKAIAEVNAQRSLMTIRSIGNTSYHSSDEYTRDVARRAKLEEVVYKLTAQLEAIESHSAGC